MPKFHPTQVNAHLFEVHHVQHTEIEQKLYNTKQNIDLWVICVFAFICLLMCFKETCLSFLFAVELEADL